MKKIFLTFLITSGITVSSSAQNVFPANGNVGIGTASPESQLHIIGSGVAGGMVNVRNTSANYYSGMNMFNENGTLAGSFQIGNSQTGGLSNTFFFGNRLSGATVIISGVYANPLATFQSNGNVGIGTTTPQNMLDVNGTIHAKKINVDSNGWPDYVFEPTYKLPDIGSLKAYIEKNHHLPGVPSEKEVSNEGVDLGKMNKILTQKVEELTLYIIKMNSRIDDLNKRIKNSRKD